MAWRSAFAVVGCAVALATVVACEDDAGTAPPTSSIDGGDVDGGAPVEPPGFTKPLRGTGADFCAKTLGVVIGALEACCTASDKETPDYDFTHGIAALMRPRCEAAIESAIEKDRVRYSAEKGEACYAAYAATYAPGKCANITQTFADPSGPTCREAFIGLGAAGAPCNGDHECEDGLTCVGGTSLTDGQCKTPPPIGEPCGPAIVEAGSGDSAVQLDFGQHPSCAPGAVCDSLTRKCVAGAALGEDCESRECATDLHCVNGACAAELGGPSSPCEVNDDCSPETFCERPELSADGTCQPKRAAGAECTGATFVTECFGRCNAAPGQTGTCASFCGSP